jgi:predicted transcriptional regulator
MVEPVTATIREAMSRKTSKNHTLPVRLSVPLWERLRVSAFKRRRTMNSIIVEALEDWLDKHETDGSLN